MGRPRTAGPGHPNATARRPKRGASPPGKAGGSKRPRVALTATYKTPLAGTPDEIVDRLGKFADAGVQRVYLQLLDVADLDHLEFFAATVMRQIHPPS